MIRLTLGELQKELELIRFTTNKDANVFVSDSNTNKDGNEYISINDGRKTEDIKITFDSPSQKRLLRK